MSVDIFKKNQLEKLINLTYSLQKTEQNMK